MNKRTKFFIRFTTAFFFISFSSKAQVGIGTSDPTPSAMLDITSDHKGLLIPRISLASLTDTSTIPSPANGLLIWNNASGGISPAGFYYWNNAKWNQIATVSTVAPVSGGWSTSGNNIGNYGGAATNLSLGTSAYDDLIFKVNSAVAGRLGTNNSVSFGNSSTAGQDAVSLGKSSVAAQDASALGNTATANGFQSLALGYMAKTNGNSETAVGYQSVTSGQNSTAIGSGAAATAQFSTAIGYNATASQQNAIVLGNSNANVGIGTSTPNTTAKLDVNGQYKLGINGSVQKNQISFEVWPSVSINNLPASKSTTLDIAVPAGFYPSATRATVTVTPASDFAGNTSFLISNPRLTSTSNITINLTNIAGSAESLYSAHFYITINEF